MIPSGGVVTHSSGVDTVNSITGGGTLNITGGILTVTTTIARTLAAKITGGTLGNARIEGTLTYSGGNFGWPPAGTLSGVKLSPGAMLAPQLDAGLTVTDGLQLDSSSVLKIGNVGGGGHVVFSGPVTAVSGNGELQFASQPSGSSRSLSIEAEAGATLEIGQGITIKTLATAGPLGGTVGSPSTTTINNGTVFAEYHPITLAGSWENNGTIRCPPGAIVTSVGIFTQNSAGLIDIEITASGASRQLSSGLFNLSSTMQTFPLAGALRITPVHGYVPCHRDTFVVMAMAAITNWGADPPGSPEHFIGAPTPLLECPPSPPCACGELNWRLHYHLKAPAQPRRAYLVLDAVLPTDVAELDRIPTAIFAYHNVPNPFNPSTTIRFDLPQASTVELSIWDSKGRRVRQLLHSSRYGEGSHRVSWDGRDDRGSRLPSGIYLYLFVAGEYRATHRMVLLK